MPYATFCLYTGMPSTMIIQCRTVFIITPSKSESDGFHCRQFSIKYDGPNGSFFNFDTNSLFRIPNFKFSIPNSAF